MLDSTRQSFLFTDHPVRSLARLVRSKAKASAMQTVTLPDDVTLVAEAGHPNRCYAWNGEMSWSVAAAIAAALKPGDTFLDVGAFAGQHSIRAARLVGPSGRVVAIEPDPRCGGFLDRNLLASGVLDAIEVRRVAVVAEPVATVHLSLNQVSMSSVLPTPGADTVEVPAVTLDDLITECQPNVVKIDVEGLDAEIIAASSALRERGAPLLVVEDNPGVRDALLAAGYAVRTLSDLMPPRSRRFYNASQDVVAIKADRRWTTFTDAFERQLRRLRVAPAVSYN